MKKLIVEIPDEATNYDVYEAVFGFVDPEHSLSCQFIEDSEEAVFRHNRLSKTWGNASYKGRK